MEKVLGLDVGKAYTKTYDGQKLNKIRSTVRELQTAEVGHGEVIVWNNKRYLVDTSEVRDMQFTGSKAEKNHYILSLYAITQYLEPNKDYNLKFSYGDNVDNYNDIATASKIRESLLGQHKVIVNSNEYRFNIEDIHLASESTGGIFFNRNEIKQYAEVMTIDIGGKNMSSLLTQFGKPIYNNEKSVSTDLGMHTLIMNLQRKLKVDYSTIEAYLINPQEYQYPQEFVNTIDSMCIQHVNKIKTYLLSYNIDIANAIQPVYFIGGGSVVLKKYIKTVFEHNPNIQINNNSQYDNVKAFYEIAKMRW